MTRALVLLSGGQDSATCLAWALETFEAVETIGFDYGQRHRVELDVRQDFLTGLRAAFPHWSARLGEDRVLDLTSLSQIGETALTRPIEIGTGASGLPNTFVPGRNLLFLIYAAAIAYHRDLRHLVTGVCETDYSGYPDCRDDTIKALQVAVNLGMERRFVIHTPLMSRDKAATWQLAQDLGGDKLIELVRSSTLTCYEGDVTTRRDWGSGCGTCPACDLRRSGYERWTKNR